MIGKPLYGVNSVQHYTFCIGFSVNPKLLTFQTVRRVVCALPTIRGSTLYSGDILTMAWGLNI